MSLQIQLRVLLCLFCFFFFFFNFHVVIHYQHYANQCKENFGIIDVNNLNFELLLTISPGRSIYLNDLHGRIHGIQVTGTNELVRLNGIRIHKIHCQTGH